MNQDNTRTSLNLLLRTSRQLATLADLPTMLARVLSLSVEALDAERGSLVVLDPAGQPQDAALIYKGQLLPHTVEQLRATVEHGLAGWVVKYRLPVLVPDTSRDERWLRRPDDAADQTGAKSALCVPLMAREQLVGILTIVHPRPGVFTPEHLALLSAISDQSGIAVHNAQLFDSLRSARARYFELFEDSIDPILITDANGRIQEANRQAELATGCTRETLVGASIFALHSAQPDLAAGSLADLHDAPLSYESSLRVQSSSDLPIEMHVRRVTFEDGDHYQWIARDISARKRLETLREDLASMIYHDLRSPLANVFSSLELLESMLGTEHANLVPVVHIAQRSTERVQRLINSLLDVRRLESGQPLAARQQVSLTRLFQDVHDYILPSAEGRGQQLVTEVDANLPDLYIDGDMIRRVLVNLLENASKFTPAGGLLAAGAARQGDLVRFWVRDSGPGIPAQMQEKIFDKFISLQAENMPRGLGLGLAFCRLAVQAHGGKIWVESKPGAGSTFFFSLPTAPDA